MEKGQIACVLSNTKGLLASFQKTVKEAKINYISEIIMSNCNKPCVLFKTIDAVLHAPQRFMLTLPLLFVKIFFTFLLIRLFPPGLLSHLLLMIPQSPSFARLSLTSLNL